MKLLSVIIPARHEQFLPNTITDVLAHSGPDTEIIVICDGEWPITPIPDQPRLTFVRTPEPIGQRAAVNLGARLSEAEFIMKLDAHCAVDQDFDLKLAEPYHNHTLSYDTTTIPRLYNLHVFDWVCKSCGRNYYQADRPPKCRCGDDKFREEIVWQIRKNRLTDFMCFDHEMHFQYWYRYHRRPEAKCDIYLQDQDGKQSELLR